MASRLLLILALVSCGPRGAREAIQWNAPFQDSHELTPEARKEWVRQQFTDPEGARARVHGGKGHVALDCPQCLDPMRAILPEEAWLTGPAEVWN